MLKLLLSTNQIFRQEKQRKTLTLFYYKIIFMSGKKLTTSDSESRDESSG